MSRKIGPYLVGETLGEGGFAKVKLGKHETSGEHVALKILKPAAVTPNTRANVEREVAAMLKLNHPNVIGLKHVDWEADYVESNGKRTKIILIVLELATGGELFDFLSFSGCFEEAIARTYFAQLINGVGYCHAQGIAHRDLKPENVLLDKDFKLKIADFGFAKAFNPTSPKASMLTECGTVGYMAPEMMQRRSEGYAGNVADVWACGVILFITLAGFPPIQKPDMSDWWFNKLAQGKHHLFWQAHSRERFFSEDFKDLINKLLCPDPARRMSLEDAMRHKWMSGERLNDEALRTQLARRKLMVDAQKATEKRAKQIDSYNEDVDMGAGLDAGLVRGMGDNSVDEDSLPSAPPTMTAFKLMQAESGIESGMGGLGGMDDAEAAVDETGKPAPYENAVACYTEVFSAAPASDLRARVLSMLGAMQGVQFAHVEGSFKLKMTVATKLGGVAIVAEILAYPGDKLNVLRFRRLAGDSSAFRNVFVQMADKLKSLCVPHPAAK